MIAQTDFKDRASAEQAALEDAALTKKLWPSETVPYTKLQELCKRQRTIPFKRWCEERAACRKDLLFLGINILGKLFTTQTHGPIADFFVKKNFDALPVNYTKKDLIAVMRAQSPTKWRMLHYPRGSYKSTIDVVDCLQWFLNCPDLRILVLTGEKSLATSFIQELKSYFEIRDGGQTTYFQKLFPEYCATARELGGQSTEFICPANRLAVC